MTAFIRFARWLPPWISGPIFFGWFVALVILFPWSGEDWYAIGVIMGFPAGALVCWAYINAPAEEARQMRDQDSQF